MKVIIRDTVCRVYYNKTGDPKKAWSLDFGEGTVELLLTQVRVLVGCRTAIAEEPPLDKEHPAGWLAFIEVNVLIDMHTGIAEVGVG